MHGSLHGHLRVKGAAHERWNFHIGHGSRSGGLFKTRAVCWLPRVLSGHLTGPVLLLGKTHHLLHGRAHRVGPKLAASLKLCHAGQIEARIHVGNIGGAHNLVPFWLCRCLHGQLCVAGGFFGILPVGGGLITGKGAGGRRTVGHKPVIMRGRNTAVDRRRRPGGPTAASGISSIALGFALSSIGTRKHGRGFGCKGGLPRARSVCCRGAAGRSQPARELGVHHVGQTNTTGRCHFFGQLLIVHALPELFLLAVQQGGLGQGFAHFFPHFLNKYGFKTLARFAQFLFLLRGVHFFAAQIAKTRQARLHFVAGNFARSCLRRDKRG